MTFKECRKYGREQMRLMGESYGYIYREKSGSYYFSFEFYNSRPPVFTLHKGGKVRKVINGKQNFDF